MKTYIFIFKISLMPAKTFQNLLFLNFFWEILFVFHVSHTNTANISTFPRLYLRKRKRKNEERTKNLQSSPHNRIHSAPTHSLNHHTSILSPHPSPQFSFKPNLKHLTCTTQTHLLANHHDSHLYLSRSPLTALHRRDRKLLTVAVA